MLKRSEGYNEKDTSTSLAYILTNKACPPLIPGTCSSPGTQDAIRSPGAGGRTGVSGYTGSSPAVRANGTAIRGRRGFLERCDCTAEGPIKQRTEALTAANAFTWEQRDRIAGESVCTFVYFPRGMVVPIKLIEAQKALSQRKTSKRRDLSTYCFGQDVKS